MTNDHPCVKPLRLCRYLATLLLPPPRETPRRLLVPFSGTGSEIIGALLAGWEEVVGIEADERFVRIAEHRIRHWVAHARQATAGECGAECPTTRRTGHAGDRTCGHRR